MPGTRSLARNVVALVSGYKATAVAAGDHLTEVVVPFDAFVGGVMAYSSTAGTGTGNTVLDVLRNGTSIWHDTSVRPTLLATSTGHFDSRRPTTRVVRAGDRLDLTVSSISSTGHARVSLSLVLERA